VRVSVDGVYHLTSSEKGNAKYALKNMHHTAHSQYLRAHVGFKIPEGTLQSDRDVSYRLLKNIFKYTCMISRSLYSRRNQCASRFDAYIIRHCLTKHLLLRFCRGIECGTSTGFLLGYSTMKQNRKLIMSTVSSHWRTSDTRL
jgi:hypothetical protein